MPVNSNVNESSDDWLFDFVIMGEPASKANSRQWVGPGKIIKSSKALSYADAFSWQCPTTNPLILDDIIVSVTIWYASRRPDLDPSVIFDGLQGKLIKNDRQIKEFHAYHDLDKENPRANIRIRRR